jgi:mRNA-degrading endonuclease RelE of RelBE toxin-antitoxin system
MDWSISLSHQARKYLKQRHIPHELLFGVVRKAIRRILGESIAVDLKALGNVWGDHYRVRIGKMRIVFSIDLDEQSVLVEVIDNRDRAYRRKP